MHPVNYDLDSILIFYGELLWWCFVRAGKLKNSQYILQVFLKKISCKAPGIRFTNAFSYFEPGPQEPYRNIF
jgi:hypothetical protein